MRRFTALVAMLFLFGFLPVLQGQDLLTEVRKLRDLRKSRQISADQFDLLLDNLINKYSKKPSPPPPSPPAVEEEEDEDEAAGEGEIAVPQGFQVTVKILALRYWRAKKLVELAPHMDLACDGETVAGNVYKNAEGDIRFAFPLHLAPGAHQLEAVYTARVRKTSGDKAQPWEVRTFRFPFSIEVRGDGRVTKVIDFVERREFLDSSGDANFMDLAAYKELLANRKKHEKESMFLLPDPGEDDEE